MAPGMIIKQIGETDEFKSLYTEIFNNLHEDKDLEEIKSNEEYKLQEFYQKFKYEKGKHYHMKWEIVNDELR